MTFRYEKTVTISDILILYLLVLQGVHTHFNVNRDTDDYIKSIY